jgi:tripartite-type tricarboxylate transporter receptor subunit TctC
MPEVAQRLGELGMEVAATPPAETRRFIAAEIAKWTKVARDNNIVIED